MKDQTSRPANRLLHGWTRIEAHGATGEGFLPFTSAETLYVRDSADTEFLDARSLVWNVAFGHSQPSIAAAIIRQMAFMSCGPTIDGQTTPVADRLAERLVALTGGRFDRVYLPLTGSAANEIAIVLARAHFAARGLPGKRLIVSLDRGYHGQSLGTLPLAVAESRERSPGPDSFGYCKVPNCYCYRCPVGLARPTCGIACVDAAIACLGEIGSDAIAAVILEPMQGSIGHPPPNEWFARLADYLRKEDILLIADEVATGFGRLGAPFAYQSFEFEPDILTLGKALTNGALPLAAVLATKRVVDPLVAKQWVPMFGSTQDGNPVCAAAACAVLDLFEADDWSERARTLGEFLDRALHAGLAGCESVSDIRGRGLFRAVELAVDQSGRSPFLDVRRLSEAIRAQRLLLHIEGNVVLFVPPFTVTENEILEIVRRFRQAIDEST